MLTCLDLWIDKCHVKEVSLKIVAMQGIRLQG